MGHIELLDFLKAKQEGTHTCWSKLHLKSEKMMSTIEKEPPNSYVTAPHPGSVHSGYSGQVPPGSHQTVVTMTTDPNVNRTEINLNIGYFTTLPGILKIVQLVFGVVCMACGSPAREYVGENYGVGHNHWFLFVIVTSFIITLLWCFFYLLQLREAIVMKLPFSWLWLELIFTAGATVMYCISFIVLLAGFGYCAGNSAKCDARVAAGVFAIFNTVAYGLGAYVLHNDYKATPPELQ